MFDLLYPTRPVHECPSVLKLPLLAGVHSVRRLVTGFAIAAFIVFKLTTINVNANIAMPTLKKSQRLMLTRYL